MLGCHPRGGPGRPKRENGKAKTLQTKTHLSSAAKQKLVLLFIKCVASKRKPHRLHQIVQRMYMYKCDLKLNFDYSSDKKVQSIWKRLGRSHRIADQDVLFKARFWSTVT
ncbi:hypothetical protein AAMO2058_001131900 [Amorphochlora amoebiformis]